MRPWWCKWLRGPWVNSTWDRSKGDSISCLDRDTGHKITEDLIGHHARDAGNRRFYLHFGCGKEDSNSHPERYVESVSKGVCISQDERTWDRNDHIGCAGMNPHPQKISLGRIPEVCANQTHPITSASKHEATVSWLASWMEMGNNLVKNI